MTRCVECNDRAATHCYQCGNAERIAELEADEARLDWLRLDMLEESQARTVFSRAGVAIVWRDAELARWLETRWCPSLREAIDAFRAAIDAARGEEG